MLAHLLEGSVSIAISAALSYLAYSQRLLTLRGSLSAFAVSAVIGVMGNLSWLLLILSFVAAAFLTTRFKILEKIRLGLQEGRKGERGSLNVVANSLPAVVVAVLSTVFSRYAPQSFYALLFTVAIGAATADTLASEVGVVDRRPRLITNMRPVPPGTDGGVSVTGTVASFMGALFISLAGFTFMVLLGQHLPLWSIPLTALAGLLGSVTDSILGATLERRGLIGKQTNNITSIAIACLVAGAALAF